MIEAKHKAWAKYIFKKYIYRQFKKNFHSFKLIGDIPDVSNRSVLLLTNHSTWWDGFFTFFLNEKFFSKKYYIMMLEDQLERFYFFQYLGAFSIKQNSPKKIVETLNYSKRLLNNDNNLVNIYPEGDMSYSFENKVLYKKGILKILNDLTSDINIVQIAIKSLHLHEEKPEVFFKMQLVDHNYLNIEYLENSMNILLATIDQNINNSKIIFEGQKSKSE